MQITIHPTYLPNIVSLAGMLQSEHIVFEACDNFQKQTLRNRAWIYGANGKLQLNIPVRYTQKHRQLYKDVKIAYDMDWRQNHKKSIESAYGSSAFFEFYQDEILPLFDLKEKFLYDLNLRSVEIFFNSLQIPFDYSLTETFKPKSIKQLDLRHLSNAKNKLKLDFKEYFQVFNVKHGFLENLSALDLICNIGPESIDYLRHQALAPTQF